MDEAAETADVADTSKVLKKVRRDRKPCCASPYPFRNTIPPSPVGIVYELKPNTLDKSPLPRILASFTYTVRHGGTAAHASHFTEEFHFWWKNRIFLDGQEKNDRTINRKLILSHISLLAAQEVAPSSIADYLYIMDNMKEYSHSHGKLKPKLFTTLLVLILAEKTDNVRKCVKSATVQGVYATDFPVTVIQSVKNLKKNCSLVYSSLVRQYAKRMNAKIGTSMFATGMTYDDKRMEFASFWSHLTTVWGLTDDIKRVIEMKHFVFSSVRFAYADLTCMVSAVESIIAYYLLERTPPTLLHLNAFTPFIHSTNCCSTVGIYIVIEQETFPVDEYEMMEEKERILKYKKLLEMYKNVKTIAGVDYEVLA